MFERFTEPARRVVVSAQAEARLLGHDFIGTEHLLLGLLRSDGIAARVLASVNVSLVDARSQVEQIDGRGTAPDTGQTVFTVGAKRALDLTLRESVLLGHETIGTEHVLLGLTHEEDSVAMRIVRAAGTEPAALRQAVLDAFSG